MNLQSVSMLAVELMYRLVGEVHYGWMGGNMEVHALTDDCRKMIVIEMFVSIFEIHSISFPQWWIKQQEMLMLIV